MHTTYARIYVNVELVAVGVKQAKAREVTKYTTSLNAFSCYTERKLFVTTVTYTRHVHFISRDLIRLYGLVRKLKFAIMYFTLIL